MTHHAAALETLRVQPASHEGKVLAAVVVLAVVDAGDLLALANEDGLKAAVAHPRQQLGRWMVVSDGWPMPSSSTLPVQLVDAPHRAVDAVRDLDRVRGGDARRLGPAAAKECGLSLRRTPGCRQKVSATTPISSMQGSTADQGCSSSHDMLGITSVPAGPGQPGGGDQSGRPPSTGLTFEKAQWTSSTPPG